MPDGFMRTGACVPGAITTSPDRLSCRCRRCKTRFEVRLRRVKSGLPHDEVSHLVIPFRRLEHALQVVLIPAYEQLSRTENHV